MKEEKQRCSTCGHIISEREIALYRGLVGALWKVYKWCCEHNVHEFKRRDIKHLFQSENETARFGDWVLFGGLVYKQKKAMYGLNMERCDAFFKGGLRIPTRIWKSPLTGEIKQEDYKTINEIPSILEMLNADDEYMANYRSQHYFNPL